MKDIKSEPLISVIVPVYKVEPYLRKCVDSILAQTYKNLEVILIDDGSPDNCPAICDEYAEKDPRVVVIHKENGGRWPARNSGLDICRGEYIGFVDSDDRIEPDMYKVLLEKLIETGSDFAECRTHVIGWKQYEIKEGPRVMDRYGIFSSYAKDDGVIHAIWDKLFKREVWDGLRFGNTTSAEDIYIITDIISRCERAVLISDKFYFYYVNQGGITHSAFNPKKTEAIDAARRTAGYYRENLPELYTCVALSAAKIIVSDMRRILNGASFFKFAKLYGTLKAELKKEYAAAEPYITEKTRDRLIVENALNHPTKFFVKNFLRGIKNELKRK